uniref:Uncharacterized protein n=1 Tax=Ananas comosus var. bracteatus TaxID=296719 RepID=A0A6V7NQW6_ANACO|nr:unnamed protein product [Ananas comosus var. bracteatus]
MTMRRAAAAAAAATLVPPWLEPLLATQFFSACPDHADAARSECNMFCLDCRPSPPAFCFYCRSDTHPATASSRYGGRRTTTWCAWRRWRRRWTSAGCRRTSSTARGCSSSTSARSRAAEGPPPPGRPRRPRTTARSAPAPSSTPSALLLGCKLVRIKRNGDASFTPTEASVSASASGSGSGGGDGDDNKRGG